jgi:hypothetical protein
MVTGTVAGWTGEARRVDQRLTCANRKNEGGSRHSEGVTFNDFLELTARREMLLTLMHPAGAESLAGSESLWSTHDDCARLIAVERNHGYVVAHRNLS